MKYKFLPAFILCVSFLNTYKSKEEQEKSEIQYISFNETNFESYRKNYDNLLVYFTAKWNKERPERIAVIDEIKDQLKNLTKNEKETYLAFGEVDSINYKIFHEYDIQRYPSIILIEGAKHMKYKGDFQSTKIINWLKHLLAKQIINLENYEEILSISQNHRSIVLFYGDSEKNKIKYELFYNMTDKFQDLHFYQFTNSSIIQHINTTEKINDPSIIIMKRYDEKLNVYGGSYNEKDLEEFIRIYSRPVLSHLDSDSYMYIMNEKKTFIALLVEDDEDETNQALEEEFYKNCLKYRNKIIGFFGDMYTTLIKEFGIRKVDLPVMIIEEFTEDKSVRKYKSIPTDFEGNGMDKFFENFFDRKLKKYLKSEKLPDNQIIKEGNIHRLVGDNFENFITNEEKWTIVFFTRKKCSMCDEFFKGFKTISDEYVKVSNIQFGMIDGELNELEHIDLKSFPTLVLFRNGTDKYKNMITFDQIASYHNIKEFLENHFGTVKNKGYARDEL